jgi:hypothetical protein
MFVEWFRSPCPKRARQYLSVPPGKLLHSTLHAINFHIATLYPIRSPSINQHPLFTSSRVVRGHVVEAIWPADRGQGDLESDPRSLC